MTWADWIGVLFIASMFLAALRRALQPGPDDSGSAMDEET